MTGLDIAALKSVMLFPIRQTCLISCKHSGLISRTPEALMLPSILARYGHRLCRCLFYLKHTLVFQKSSYPDAH